MHKPSDAARSDAGCLTEQNNGREMGPVHREGNKRIHQGPLKGLAEQDERSRVDGLSSRASHPIPLLRTEPKL